MEEHLYALLSGAVSFPIAWGTLGRGVRLPRAAMYRIGGPRDHHMNGLGNITYRVQIDCYGETYLEALGASRDIRGTLEGYRGGPIQGAFLQAVRDLPDDDAGLLHRVSLTFLVHSRD